jgi:tRNA(fMet)-specific endonuclease VapC
MNYILDTNVISELVKQKPNKKVVTWLEKVDPDNIYLSVITLGEIRKGIEKLPASKRKNTLNSWFNDELLLRFHNRILPLELPVLLTWGELTARLEKIGNPLPAIDSLLAATALQAEFTLVTRNTEDFKHSGISLSDPWK